jgi:hypothetical protein
MIKGRFTLSSNYANCANCNFCLTEILEFSQCTSSCVASLRHSDDEGGGIS